MQKWSTLDQIWSNPKMIFLRFLLRFFCPKFYVSKLLKVFRKYFMNINSFMNFQVGPEVVQGGPLLVQPRVSSTFKRKIYIYRVFCTFPHENFHNWAARDKYIGHKKMEPLVFLLIQILVSFANAVSSVNMHIITTWINISDFR